MSVRYEEIEVKPLREHRPVSGTCDACGREAWHSGHRRPPAIFSRIRDDGQSNMDIWDLDLCTACTASVLDLLQDIALCTGHVLPNTRSEVFDS